MLNKISNLKVDIIKDVDTPKKNEFEKFLKEKKTEINQNSKTEINRNNELNTECLEKQPREIEEDLVESDKLSEEILGLLNFSKVTLEIKELLAKLEEKPLEIKEILFTIEAIDNKLTKILDTLDSNKEFENLLLGSLKGNEGKINIKDLEKLFDSLKTMEKITEKILEPIVKGISNAKDLTIEKNVLSTELDLNKKETLKSLSLELDKKLNDKGISIKDLISKLENIERIFVGKESIENLGEFPKIENENKSFDLKIITEEKNEVKVKSEDEILETIIDDEKPKEDFSFFNKRLEALKKGDAKSDTPIIRKSNIEVDLVKSIKYINRDGLKELTVKVYPRDLGEIVISISKEDGLLKASLKANSKDTYNIISQNTAELKKLLGDGGIKIENIDISLYEDTTFYNESEFKKENSENKRETTEFSDEYIEEEIFEENDDDGILNIFA